MTAPIRGTPHASALPASQTAPVAEFRCLFTHDIRRKQKRWQDGYLKFHTFNNRVMVSDQARNHVSDTYWKESNELQEGDELTLNNGVMVEVAEAMGITQTDLAPLFEKRAKEPAKETARPTPSAAVRPFQRPTSVAPSNVARTSTQLRHKSLNSLLGTPKGPVGKAVPMKSPYEARKEQEKENEVTQERAPKRQKIAGQYRGWRASSPVDGEDSPPSRTTPLWAKTADAKIARSPQLPRTAKVIAISSESDHIPVLTSDVTLPSLPTNVTKAKTAPHMTPAPTIQSSVRHEPPTVQTRKLSRGKVPLPRKKAVETPEQPAPTLSPPVSASNRLTNVDFAVQAVQPPPKKSSPKPSPPRNPKAKSLRLSTGVKPPVLQAKLTSDTAHDFENISDGTANVFDDPEVYHGLMDQQLLVLSSPVQPDPPRSFARTQTPEGPSVKGNKKQQTKCSKKSVSNVPEGANNTKPKSSKAASKHEKPARMAPEKSHTARTVPPPPKAVFAPPISPSRETSPTHTEASVSTSRTPSASPAKSVVSTGGFRKKPKRQSKEDRTHTSQPPGAAAPRSETVALPPHPLGAAKDTPLMSTTELASLLKKPKKRPRTEDPIKEDGKATGKSPARKIRRVRSANDAPIPSTAEDWEKRNLPKTSSNLTEAESSASVVPPKKKESALAALTRRTDPRKKLQRMQSLNVDTNVAYAVEPDLPSPVIDRDVGPWSTEAFDLFDWRPPNRDIAAGAAG
ncbi:hypothetical protein EK21DRAFT_70346 [Setomelanomma holmii]|uniref:5'-3' DNA helicase ZGRF1-like N-terminal domain-containing protein n=1 Tax=Setomelanomma holmii TaxID=210430 RepID=A0A9P4LKG5_9PLEO|nr:hypothetical protein EK21DRAFT_70346 [Setomelanomma holmii]